MSRIHKSIIRRFGLARNAGLIAAGLIAGGVAASAFGASAATPSATYRSTAGTVAACTAAPAPNKQSTPVHDDEKAVSSADAATLKAAALKTVPGGTVYGIESDTGDGAYEAHMTKADGTLVTVKFDKSLAVTKVENGMGDGDPAPTSSG